jgi:hypothetical protein
MHWKPSLYYNSDTIFFFPHWPYILFTERRVPVIQCIIFKFRKWHTCNYEWYRLYRPYENCRRPGVAILDMQMSKVPIISGYGPLVRRSVSLVFRPKDRYRTMLNLFNIQSFIKLSKRSKILIFTSRLSSGLSRWVVGFS